MNFPLRRLTKDCRGALYAPAFIGLVAKEEEEEWEGRSDGKGRK